MTVHATPRLAWRNAFVVAFLAVQAVLPVRGFVHDKVETRGNFSWNMYSQDFRVDARYILRRPGGRAQRIEPNDYFRGQAKYATICHRDTLPRFHEFLCREFDEQGTLVASVKVAVNYQEDVVLVRAFTPICTADNFGVLPEPGAGAE